MEATKGSKTFALGHRQIELLTSALRSKPRLKSACNLAEIRGRLQVTLFRWQTHPKILDVLAGLDLDSQVCLSSQLT